MNGEKFCDCPVCPCAWPVTGARQRDCEECRDGKHLSWKTAERLPKGVRP